METKRIEAAAVAAAPETLSSAKVQNFMDESKDILKILAYFRYTIGTTLDAAQATGVLRNSITYYVDYLEKEGLLQAVSKRPDSTTGYLAKHYSADPAKWKRNVPRQLSLFDVPSIGEVAETLVNAPIIDGRSGEVNILAALKQRKEVEP